ncbi:MAG: hypothetical protein ATN36_08600 [Epulopiscium sp. Nele67-Bin005]|nr:MAG: hypothetical protein ATN36_08600 [Epulopiscium sp. Nele67-Bin005]
MSKLTDFFNIVSQKKPVSVSKYAQELGVDNNSTPCTIHPELLIISQQFGATPKLAHLASRLERHANDPNLIKLKLVTILNETELIISRLELYLITLKDPYDYIYECLTEVQFLSVQTSSGAVPYYKNFTQNEFIELFKRLINLFSSLKIIAPILFETTYPKNILHFYQQLIISFKRLMTLENNITQFIYEEQILQNELYKLNQELYKLNQNQDFGLNYDKVLLKAEQLDVRKNNFMHQQNELCYNISDLFIELHLTYKMYLQIAPEIICLLKNLRSNSTINTDIQKERKLLLDELETITQISSNLTKFYYTLL